MRLPWGRYEEQCMFFDASGLIEEPPIMYWYMDEQGFTEKGKTVFDILEAEIKFSIAIKERRQERNR